MAQRNRKKNLQLAPVRTLEGVKLFQKGRKKRSSFPTAHGPRLKVPEARAEKKKRTPTGPRQLCKEKGWLHYRGKRAAARTGPLFLPEGKGTSKKKERHDKLWHEKRKPTALGNFFL